MRLGSIEEGGGAPFSNPLNVMPINEGVEESVAIFPSDVSNIWHMA